MIQSWFRFMSPGCCLGEENGTLIWILQWDPAGSIFYLYTKRTYLDGSVKSFGA